MPLVGASNWFDANQTPSASPTSRRRADGRPQPLLPGWQLAIPTVRSYPAVTPATPGTPVVVTFPSSNRIPSDGPFAFLANPFLLPAHPGRRRGPSLQDIATARVGFPAVPAPADGGADRQQLPDGVLLVTSVAATSKPSLLGAERDAIAGRGALRRALTPAGSGRSSSAFPLSRRAGGGAMCGVAEEHCR